MINFEWEGASGAAKIDWKEFEEFICISCFRFLRTVVISDFDSVQIQPALSN
jgi:hypothetical protein